MVKSVKPKQSPSQSKRKSVIKNAEPKSRTPNRQLQSLLRDLSDSEESSYNHQAEEYSEMESKSFSRNSSRIAAMNYRAGDSDTESLSQDLQGIFSPKNSQKSEKSPKQIKKTSNQKLLTAETTQRSKNGTPSIRSSAKSVVTNKSKSSETVLKSSDTKTKTSSSSKIAPIDVSNKKSIFKSLYPDSLGREEMPGYEPHNAVRRKNQVQFIAGANRQITTKRGMENYRTMTRKIKDYQLRAQGNLIAASQFRSFVRDCAGAMGFKKDTGLTPKMWSLSAMQLLQKCIEEMMVTRMSAGVLLASHGKRITLKDVDVVLLKRLKIAMRKDIKLRSEL